MLLVTYLKLMRMFRSDAADGVHNVINLCITAGERMGQRDVRKGVVGAVPADLKSISIKITSVKMCLMKQSIPAFGWHPSTFGVVQANLLRDRGRPRNSSGRPRRGMGH